MKRIAPSILAADLADLAAAAALAEAGAADLLHVDVMDGHFVPNLTFGPPVVAALARHTRIPLDVHLMVSNPDRLLDSYLEAGAARVAVHLETAPHLDRTLASIRERGARAGVAINPATPVEALRDALPRSDFVLVMSVNPGFSGQKFLPRALDKVRRLAALARAEAIALEIEIDGGVDRATLPLAAAAGADIFVVGAAAYGAPDPAAEIRALRRLANAEAA